jgi:alpha-1,3-mannosyltransferase
MILVVFSVTSLLVLLFGSYTEIDFKTYMQQVEHFWNGERDYYQISGDSGPLVYPAGFLYLFSAIKYLTSDGDIMQAQLVF